MDQTVRECDRCNGTAASTGRRCSRRTCKIAGLCYQHLRSAHGVEIKKSTIPGAGMGLFAARDIVVRRGKPTPILPYGGDPLTASQVKERYPDASPQYVMCTSGDRCQDGRSTQSSAARYANGCDRRGQGLFSRCNSKFTGVGKLAATRTIKKGEEILVRYGPEYWKK